MGLISRGLQVNVTVSSTWCQLQNAATSTAYTVPTSGSNPRADLKDLRALNLSSGSCQVELAISSGSLPADQAMAWSRKSLTGYGMLVDNGVHVIPSGAAIWVRVLNAVGSPNVTFRGALLEVS